MRRQFTAIIALLIAFCSVSVAQVADTDTLKASEPNSKKELRREKAKEEWNAHFDFYGFVRNYLTYDTRQVGAPLMGMYYFIPKDVNLNEYGQDLNATPEFRYLCITTRLGLDIHDYRYKSTHFGAKIETDFAFTANGSMAVALRLRHAYFTMTWKDLPMAKGKTASVRLLMGQTWHPISIGYAPIVSFETGSPFDTSNRCPQITMDATLDGRFTITGSLMTQMQYCSTGPVGSSIDYTKYGLTPEAFAAFTYKENGFMLRTGVNVLSIKPRKTGKDINDVEVLVKDRITTFCPYLFLEYKYNDFLINGKAAYGQAGEHINLLSGYAVSAKNPDGSWEYTPLQSATSWMYVQYGKKFIGGLFGGYFKNFGTIKPIHEDMDIYVNGFSSKTLTQAWRIIPSFQVNLGKFMIGLEYNYTAAQFGSEKSVDRYGIARDGLHWVGDHRILAMFQYAW